MPIISTTDPINKQTLSNNSVSVVLLLLRKRGKHAPLCLYSVYTTRLAYMQWLILSVGANFLDSRI